MTDYTDPSRPFAFIQWKGTDVCLDFHCRCGARGHFDGDFAYGLRCSACGTTWEMPIFLVPTAEIEEGDVCTRDVIMDGFGGVAHT